MKKALIVAAAAEAATGSALLIVPSIVGQLLLGEELTGVAIPIARVAGIALIALGIASWCRWNLIQIICGRDRIVAAFIERGS